MPENGELIAADTTGGGFMPALLSVVQMVEAAGGRPCCVVVLAHGTGEHGLAAAAMPSVTVDQRQAYAIAAAEAILKHPTVT